jgi:hypothetical protein
MLTKAAIRVLKDLAEDEDCDLVAEGIIVYCGHRQTNWKVLRQLLDHVAVSITFGGNNGMMKENGATYFGINGVGEAILRRPALADEVYLQVWGRKGPFSIKDDRIEPLTY